MIEALSPETAPAAPPTLSDIHADLARRAVVNTAKISWEPSPSGTVWRKPLYREGGESGLVTSLVRYAPGGAFPEHVHPEGEEILVLEGEFADEHGRYPPGTWIRIPHLSRHTRFRTRAV
jgi:anti-sigma factor ChrR (cupin superfamily)